MDLSLFNYHLPEHLIAQTPIEKRDGSKLLTMNKLTGEISHKHFYDIENFLSHGDCLILNNSKVIPARLFGTRNSGGKVEVLLLRQKRKDSWEALIRPGRRVSEGQEIKFSDRLSGVAGKLLDDGKREIDFFYAGGSFYEILDKVGNLPLPPYIKTTLNQKERYQTVYAKHKGSAAAPTAGLHFTNELLSTLKKKGIEIGFVTLHVGLGTFRPVKTEDITRHKMHSEYFSVPLETSQLVRSAKQQGRRIVSVGTTAVRTLESAFDENGELLKAEGETDIFIYPGYNYKITDALITNFHLPESTLLMLVSAFSRREFVLNAYAQAIKNSYRFFSFGDAMYIY